MDATAWTAIGVIVTILIFVLTMIHNRTKENTESVKDVKEDLEDHKVEVHKHFSTKEEVVQMIGLISAPIEKSVLDIKDEIKQHKADQREENKLIHQKLDLMLANQAKRREND